MLLLPPLLSKRIYVIAAARRRRIATTVIAQAMGISQQAVNQFLHRYEKYHGAISVPELRKHKRRKAGTKLGICRGCGASLAVKYQFDRKPLYCSSICANKHMTILSRSEVIWAIEQRTLHCATWTGIAKILRTDMQTVQNAIWTHLMAEDRLRKEIVGKIWQPATSLMVKRGRWGWLERRNGASPS